MSRRCPQCGALDPHICGETYEEMRIARRRAEYNANEDRRALEWARGILAQGRTTGNHWQKAALAAENFIIAWQEGCRDDGKACIH